jgi:hypothetical protein
VWTRSRPRRTRKNIGGRRSIIAKGGLANVLTGLAANAVRNKMCGGMSHSYFLHHQIFVILTFLFYHLFY